MDPPPTINIRDNKVIVVSCYIEENTSSTGCGVLLSYVEGFNGSVANSARSGALEIFVLSVLTSNCARQLIQDHCLCSTHGGFCEQVNLVSSEVCNALPLAEA